MPSLLGGRVLWLISLGWCCWWMVAATGTPSPTSSTTTIPTSDDEEAPVPLNRFAMGGCLYQHRLKQRQLQLQQQDGDVDDDDDDQQSHRLTNKTTTSSSSTTIPTEESMYPDGGTQQEEDEEELLPLRVCNSDDPPTAAARGYCRADDPFRYMELRIHGQTWEAALFETWILQILLSEWLHVPTSVEASMPDAATSLNFYHEDGTVDWSGAKTDDWQCLETGVRLGDCRHRPVKQRQPPNHRHREDMDMDQITEDTNTTTTSSDDEDDDDYQSCCHFIPEVWEGPDFEDQAARGTIEPAQPMGTIGEEYWFVPKFTSERDPTLMSYVGLQGPANRRKLAARFGRPTTWKEYCENVSTTNCQQLLSPTNGTVAAVVDPIAKRPPTIGDGPDANRFFVEGLYQGHFRMTVDNDCDLNPTTCTGHIFDYPCTWQSHIPQQAYHLDIAVQGDGTQEGGSGGYPYADLVDAILAANATKSDILFYWWTPEALYQQFIGTDMEFTKITMPPVTQECLDHRVPIDDRCSMSLTDRVGDPRGACGEVPYPLKKVIGAGLYDVTYNSGIPNSLQSPGYELLRAFQMSGAEIGQVFDYWKARQQARHQERTNATRVDNNSSSSRNNNNNNDPREAVCEWVVENLDRLQQFIPRTYPRVIQHRRTHAGDGSTPFQALPFVALLLACLAIATIVVASIWTYRRRHCPALQFAQLEFLSLLLLGLFLVSIGALLRSLPPKDGLCMAAVWLNNVGYQMELIPLIVKMAAIYRIMQAAKRMRQVTVTRKSLFGAVVFWNAVMIIFLICWTILDPSRVQAEYELTKKVTDNQEVIVYQTVYCQADSQGWQIGSLGWHFFLLVVATIQAYLTRRIRSEINESQTLAIMIYSHVMFVLLRVALLLLQGSISAADMRHSRSIIFSLDCIMTVAIYFVPKLMSDGSEFEQSQYMIESQTVKQLRMLAAIATAQHERQINRMERQGEGCSPTREERPSLRLSLQPEQFKAHLKNVDPTAYTGVISDPSTFHVEEPESMVIMDRRSTGEDGVTVPSLTEVSSYRQCRHCGKYD